MELTHSEKALRRGLAYQYWSGLPRTPDTEIRALESLLRALKGGEPDVLGAVMADLRATAAGASPSVPGPTPAIRRGSLHYGDY
ncbi:MULTISPECIES: hypothetical protein [Halomonadaceae]|uniref:Uncharacterized protein n=1 Tax=Vreelandella halophila TaxID=86177 RepID=A0A9X5B6X9_9GAMM|nr:MULTISPECIES: hypothetical protein [Halomonas]MYL27989.1 hypothetical protein [Halomonas utahensis]MYL75624.1 hypothetical protein [Halomonas sp. 22501_18_FS]